MKRQNKKSKQATRSKSNNGRQTPTAVPNQDGQPAVSRRTALVKLRDYGIVVALAGGAGWYALDHVGGRFAEYDLSRIGNGVPAVVQIHDPGCPLCRELQRQTRQALAAFDDGELQYIVADIKTEKGRELAAAHGVQHVTLVLFDGQGRRLDILAGSNTADFLEGAFRRHLVASEKAVSS